MLDFDLKERVRSAVDIVDVIGSSLTLEPKGRMLAARCPWHDDRSPSLTINQERQTWKCWVCNIGGDVFSFVMQRDGVDFPTALKLLADQAGIEYQTGPKAEPGSKDDKAALIAATKLVSDAYFENLDNPQSDDAKIALEYLQSRGVDAQHRKLFRIGFAPDSWDFAVNLLRREKFRPEVALAAGLAHMRNSGSGAYDFFRGRLMFPIHDMQNRVISMGGRVIPKIAERQGDKVGGKYINGPETKLFRKSQQLYGLNLARESIRKRDQALVMEGYTDVIAARQAGVEPVVAVLGTALGEHHVKLLKRLTSRVVLVLDGDAAGQQRAEEVLEIFIKEDADLRILTLPENMDPADFLQQNGAVAFQTLVDKAPDALEHKLTNLVAGVDMTHDTHAVMQAIDTMTGILAKAPKLDPVKQDQIMLRLSRTFGIASNRLEDRLEKKRNEEASRRKRASRFQKPNAGSSAPATRPQNPNRSLDPNQLLSEVVDAPYDDSFAAPSAGFDVGTQIASSPSTGDYGSDNAAEREEPLSGYDRELFETMIESPDLAARAVETVNPDWLDTLAAKMILSAYQELELEGRDLDVESLLLLLENDFLKNEIVTLQFRVAQRDGKSTQTVEERFVTVLERFGYRETVAEKQRQIAKLETDSLNEDEELELLKQLFDGEKDRQQLDK